MKADRFIDPDICVAGVHIATNSQNDFWKVQNIEVRLEVASEIICLHSCQFNCMQTLFFQYNDMAIISHFGISINCRANIEESFTPENCGVLFSRS